MVAKIPKSEQLIIVGDWKGHIRSQSTGFGEMHGGQAIGKRNTEGERILEFAFANELVVGNTWFKKPQHLVTFQSGNAATQIDHPVLGDFQETGVQREDHPRGGVCIRVSSPP